MFAMKQLLIAAAVGIILSPLFPLLVVAGESNPP
jgi:hypothetical protein